MEAPSWCEQRTSRPTDCLLKYRCKHIATPQNKAHAPSNSVYNERSEGDNMRYLAIDPGATTGLCLASCSDDKYEALLWTEVNTRTPSGFSEVADVIRRSDPTEVLYERMLVQRPGFDTTGLQVIGVLRFVAYELGIEMVTQVQPAARRPVEARGFEKPAGWGRHGWDAFLHIAAHTRSVREQWNGMGL